MPQNMPEFQPGLVKTSIIYDGKPLIHVHPQIMHFQLYTYTVSVHTHSLYSCTPHHAF